MSRDGDDLLAALREGVEAYAEDEAAALVVEAQIEARAKVRALLVEAIAERLLERAEEHLADAVEPPATGRAQPRVSGQRRDDRPAVVRGSGTPATGFYVYGIVDPREVTDDQLAAVVSARSPLELVRAGSVAAVASPVGLEEFGEDGLAERLEDLGWLEETARGHEHVLEQVREWATVVPMRLCTVYTSRESLRESLVRQQPFLLDALIRLADKTEWGVKLIVDRDATLRPAADDGGGATDADGGEDQAGLGRAYMLGRRRDAERTQQSAQHVQEICEEAHERLSMVAIDAVLNRPQPPELAQHSGEMALNAVYLVADAERDTFAAEVRELQREHELDGVEFELTGPWPPYNFVGDAFEVSR